MRILFISGISLLLFMACTPALNLHQEEFKKKIVVEGYIESGEFPYVYLSYTSPFFQPMDSALLYNLSLRYAKVTVSDGENSEILTGHYFTDFFPYFVYRGHRIKGQENKTYTLKIEVDQQVILAETTIPPAVSIDKIYTTVKSDTTRVIHIGFNHRNNKSAGYKVFSRIWDLNNKFVPCFQTIQSEKTDEGEIEMALLKGRDKLDQDTVYLYYPIDHRVTVKLCTMDDATTAFWKSMGNESLSEINLVTGSTTKLKSNIPEPGIGIWGGYGISSKSINIE